MLLATLICGSSVRAVASVFSASNSCRPFEASCQRPSSHHASLRLTLAEQLCSQQSSKCRPPRDDAHEHSRMP
jgi:hypothetical protein